MNETTIEAGNDVGRFIQSEMKRRGWSLRDAEAMSAKKNKRPFSYEHLRKIIKGNTEPSAEMLEKIAKTFNLQPSVLLTMHHKATITRKYGPDYLETMEINPKMYEIDSLIKGLLPKQLDMVEIQIRALVQGNIDAGKVVLPSELKRGTGRGRRRKA